MISDWIRFIASFPKEWSIWTTLLVWTSVSAILIFTSIVGISYLAKRLNWDGEISDGGIMMICVLAALWPFIIALSPVLFLLVVGIIFFYMVIKTARKLSDDINARR